MKHFIPFLLLLCSLSVSAKLTQFIVRGYTVRQDYSKADWNRQGVDSVFVGIVHNDTIPVDFRMLSGDDSLKMTTAGEFRILVQGGVGKYTIFLNRQGYEPLRHDFKVVSEGQDVVNLRTLPLEPRRENTLNEVEVVGTAIKMVMKGDTIVYDSRAFQLPDGSMLDALVSQLPGAQLESDGSISVNGKKVNSLLLNGNDFFKGDPEVALKNLPAYTVDKIKVYDKASKEDRVTLESQTLSTSVDDENIVMDVMLKKEFAMATIVSVEGGYGPGIYNAESPQRLDNRYLGRAFVIGFGKNYRWAAYGGYNNIHNSSKASSNGKNWGSNWSSDRGDGPIALGGFDVFYTPTRKWELFTSLSYQGENSEYEELTAKTKFYESGNMYQRSRLWYLTKSDKITANADIRYLGDKFTFYLGPTVDWYRSTGESRTFWANFTSNPVESSRGEAIDSLFSSHAPSWLTDSLTSASYRASNSDPDQQSLNINLVSYATWRPTKGRGLFLLSASGRHNSIAEKYGQIYRQPYDASDSAINQEQWMSTTHDYDSWGANITYEWDKKHIGTNWISTYNVEPAVGWDLKRDFVDNAMLAQVLSESFDPSSRPLPSVTAPENLIPLLSYDANNTYRTLDLHNEVMGRLYLKYVIEKAAPTDSGFNPYLSINLNLTHRQFWRHYTMTKRYDDFAWGKNSCDPTDMASLNVSFRQQNQLHSLSLYMGYTFSTELSSIAGLVPSMSNLDPLNVYEGAKEGFSLLTPYNHASSLYLNYYGNKSHQMGYLSMNYNRYANQLAQTSRFDPRTGITYHEPKAVSGNWTYSLRSSYEIPFGLHDCWSTAFGADYGHNNSIDYVSDSGEPVRSLVKTNDIGGNIQLSYKLKNGTRFAIGGGTSYQHSASPRLDFQTISAWHSNARVGVDFYLPFGIQGTTYLSATFRRGYQDSALNNTDWLWNANIRKSFLKGALTCGIDAVDILGQISNISYSVNAQGRTETWYNTLPRYVMFSVAYRFNFTPKALK